MKSQRRLLCLLAGCLLLLGTSADILECPSDHFPVAFYDASSGHVIEALGGQSNTYAGEYTTSPGGLDFTTGCVVGLRWKLGWFDETHSNGTLQTEWVAWGNWTGETSVDELNPGSCTETLEINYGQSWNNSMVTSVAATAGLEQCFPEAAGCAVPSTASESIPSFSLSLPSNETGALFNVSLSNFEVMSSDYLYLQGEKTTGNCSGTSTETCVSEAIGLARATYCVPDDIAPFRIVSTIPDTSIVVNKNDVVTIPNVGYHIHALINDSTTVNSTFSWSSQIGSFDSTWLTASASPVNGSVLPSISDYYNELLSPEFLSGTITVDRADVILGTLDVSAEFGVGFSMSWQYTYRIYVDDPADNCDYTSPGCPPNSVSGVNSTATGSGVNIAGHHNLVVNSHNVTVNGHNNYVYEASNVVINGNRNSVMQGDSIIISGNDDELVGNRIICYGSSNALVGDDIFMAGSRGSILGSDNTIGGDDVFIDGDGNTVYGNGAEAHGSQNYISGGSTSIYGDGNSIDGTRTIVSGDNNVLDNADDAYVAGNANLVSEGPFTTLEGDSNAVTGESNNITGDGNDVTGDYNTVVGNANAVLGGSNQVTGDNLNVIGSNLMVPEAESCAAPSVECPLTGECVATILECLNGTAGTVGADTCPPDTSLCWSSGECVDDFDEDCDPVPGCADELPLRCWNGTCLAEDQVCSEAPACPSGETLCNDGVCRDLTSQECPEYYGCPINSPFRCPDGQCGESSGSCGSEVCPLGKVLCWDDSCQSSRSECITPPFLQEFEETELVPTPGEVALNSTTGDLLLELEVDACFLTSGSSGYLSGYNINLGSVPESRYVANGVRSAVIEGVLSPSGNGSFSGFTFGNLLAALQVQFSLSLKPGENMSSTCIAGLNSQTGDWDCLISYDEYASLLLAVQPDPCSPAGLLVNVDSSSRSVRLFRDPSGYSNFAQVIGTLEELDGDDDIIPVVIATVAIIFILMLLAVLWAGCFALFKFGKTTRPEKLQEDVRMQKAIEEMLAPSKYASWRQLSSPTSLGSPSFAVGSPGMVSGTKMVSLSRSGSPQVSPGKAQAIPPLRPISGGLGTSAPSSPSVFSQTSIPPIRSPRMTVPIGSPVTTLPTTYRRT